MLFVCMYIFVFFSSCTAINEWLCIYVHSYMGRKWLQKHH
uniref:Uncharacterized protein n=1 Tax=Lepeophtheirus salmonis TaxID=72036 RepID=A0A0K2T5U2_LEPSM